TVDDPDVTLVFSFIGMLTQEVQVGNQTEINITMERDAIGLEEVVAIGYGTQKKVNLTGSVETIEGEKLARQPAVQTSQALVGLAPGLTAIQSSGQPGNDGATLRIRGIGSIGASNNPLVLVDGVETDINRVDANDIESISILKDASSASIYGSRASNGVILVTTKRAKSGELKVNYKNYFGVQNITDYPKYLGALDFLKYSGEDQSVIDNYSANMKTNPDLYPDTDWVNELFTENGFQQYHNLAVNGGTDKIKVFASISYTDQTGNIANYDYDKYTGLFNTDFKISDKFDIEFDINYNKSVTNSPTTGLGLITQQAFRIPPIYNSVHSDGSWGDGWAGRNPIAEVTDGGLRNNYQEYFRGKIKANYRLLPDLKLSVTYSPEYYNGFGKSFSRTFHTIIDWEAKSKRAVNFPNKLSQWNNRSFTDNFNAVLNYSKRIKEHNISALLGYEFIKYQSENFGASRTDFVLQDYQYLNAGSEENDGNYGSATHWGLMSYFARFNYSFKDKYLLEANIRRDASSRFAENNRIAYFPSFSAGWRLSEEDFIKNLGVFTNLKLRASWGQLGNQQIGSDFPYASTIAIGANNFIFNNEVATGAAQNVLANSGIKWETTEATNFGIDAGLLDSRLSLTAEYYIRKTKDILLRLPIPLSVGLTPSMQNAGNVENRGIDLSLGWRDAIGDFSYGARFIFSDVKNEVTNLAGIGPIISGSSIIEVGSPINMIYAYETVGVFQDQTSIDNAPAQVGTLIPGNLQYKDQLTVDTDGDGIADQADGMINADDRVVLGNPFPRMTYGIDLNAAYKGFDFSVSVQGVGKRDVILGGDMVWPLYNAGKIQEWQANESWSEQNKDARFPILEPTSFGSNDIQNSSTWVFDASYLRIRNITLGYTFPESLVGKIKVDNIRLYVSGQNLFTFDNMPDGFDPIVPNGSHGAIYPITSAFIMGVNVKF
ncbi:MAG: TonB-dependent receptor, partial [Bacteroidota bacterium]